MTNQPSLIKKITNLLNNMFAPRVTVYINREKVTTVPKWAKSQIEEMQKDFNNMIDQLKNL